jgi:hypothetical protein
MNNILKVNSEEELLQKASNLFHILVNLRDKTKKWENHGGYINRQNRKYWEKKADEFIKENLFISGT